MTGQRILLVDGPPETEQVLKAVLEPRGLQINRVHGQDRETCRTESLLTSLVIIDQTRQRSQLPRSLMRLPQVVICHPGRTPANPSEAAETLMHPFHYGDLIQAIERLLSRSDGEG